jgi:hypothetical protein
MTSTSQGWESSALQASFPTWQDQVGFYFGASFLKPCLALPSGAFLFKKQTDGGILWRQVFL